MPDKLKWQLEETKKTKERDPRGGEGGQKKKKKKLDAPVPQCIASRQLHSGSWCFRKAQSHLAPVSARSS